MDNRINDAINLFKYSPVADGATNLGGDAAYQERYRRLAQAVVDKLWRLWSADEIEFVALPPDLTGDAAIRSGADIRVNKLIEPSGDPTVYPNAANQGKVAATACLIVHEATHLVSRRESYPEDELMCRNLEGFLFRFLQVPRAYQSRFANCRCTCQYLVTTPFHYSYQYDSNRSRSADLIDSLFDMEEYRRDLETSATAEFIRRSLSWWNGLENRWPSTRGYYLRSLASREDRDYADAILTVLESFTRPQWVIAKTVTGNLDRIRQRLATKLYEISYSQRILRVQDTIGDYFGIRRV